jgi:peptidoglycan/LPS O-acetylase OafA/YrhL
VVEVTPAPVLQRRDATIRPRYAALDGMRFFAALAVLAFHYTARTTDVWPTQISEVAPALFDFTKYGFFGVDLFFVISGFVILLSAWDRPLSAFAASRIARLYPAYWVAVLLTAAVLITAGRSIPIDQIAANLTMGQELLGVPHVDGVYWTLWVELRFYLLMGVFILVGITENRVIAFCLLWPLVAILAESTKFEFLSTLLVWQHSPLFAGGMAIFLLTRNVRSAPAWLALGLNVAFAMTTAGTDAANSIRGTTGSGIPHVAQWGLIALCFVVVLVVTLTPVRRIGWSWLTTIGALTYPVYLLHEQIGWQVIRVVQPFGWGVAVVAATVVSLALAILVYRFVEVPFAPRLRRTVLSALGPTPGKARRASR